MGFFTAGYKWEQNPGLAQANQYGQQAADLWAGRHDKGENYWRRILRGAKQGDFSMLGNPFLSQEAAQNRLVASHADPFLPPELAAAQTRNAQAHNAENAGINFENYIRQSLGQAATGAHGASVEDTSGEANAYQNLANNQIQGYQGHQTASGLSTLMSVVGPAVGAATGLGWTPFKSASG